MSELLSRMETQPTLHGFETLPMTDGDFQLRAPRERVLSVGEYTVDFAPELLALQGLDDLQGATHSLYRALALPLRAPDQLV
jgi:hypothetical protein